MQSIYCSQGRDTSLVKSKINFYSDAVFSTNAILKKGAVTSSKSHYLKSRFGFDFRLRAGIMLQNWRFSLGGGLISAPYNLFVRVDNESHHRIRIKENYYNFSINVGYQVFRLKNNLTAELGISLMGIDSFYNLSEETMNPNSFYAYNSALIETTPRYNLFKNITGGIIFRILKPINYGSLGVEISLTSVPRNTDVHLYTQHSYNRSIELNATSATLFSVGFIYRLQK